MKLDTSNNLMFVFAVQSFSPLRLSSVSDGVASSSSGAVTADSDSLLQQGSSSCVKRRQVSCTWLCE